MRRVFAVLVSAVFVVSLVVAWCATDSPFDSPSLWREARRYAEKEIDGWHSIFADDIIAARFAEHAARHGNVSALLDYLEKHPNEIYNYRDKLARLVCNQDDPKIIRRGLELTKTRHDSTNFMKAIFTEIAAACFEREDFLVALRECVDSVAGKTDPLPEKERWKTKIWLDGINIVFRIADCRKARGDESVFRPRRSAFKISQERFSNRSGFIVSDLISDLLWTYRDQEWELDKFFDLMGEGKDAEAKLIFDEIVAKIPNEGVPNNWGAVNQGTHLCGMAMLAIELGKPDWAQELYPKIVIPPCDNSMQQYALNLRMDIAEIQIALGEPQKGWKTLEGICDGEPSMSLRPDGIEISIVLAQVPFCDIAVAIAQSDDREGAAAILRKIVDDIDEIEHPSYYEDAARGALKAAEKIGDAPLCKEIIASVFDSVSREYPKNWSLKSKIAAACVVAECALGDIDAAKKIVRENEMAFQTNEVVFAVVDALILQKRYDEAAAFPDQESECEMKLVNANPHADFAISSFQNPHRTASVACRVASAQFADGNRESALQTLKKAASQIRKMNHPYPKEYVAGFADIAIELEAINKQK